MTKVSPKKVAAQVPATVPQGNTALAFAAKPGRGFEAGYDKEDIIIPRAKLIQALSPEMTDKEIRKTFPNIQTGSIINSLTKEPLAVGEEGVEFVPVFMFKNYIRFNPRSADKAGFDSNFEPGAIIWRSNDHLDPRVQAETKFGPAGEKPVATTFLNFFCYVAGQPMPVIVSFSKTSYGAGKQLLSLARMKGGDMFAHKYRLTSDMETNDIATFAVLKISAAGAATPEEYQVCEQLWTEFAQKVGEIKVHEEGTDDAEATPQAQPAGRPY